jgi:hypothetical protein
MKETGLFLPVKHLFESLGFEVEAEIEHIDMVAKKEARWIAIELKKELNVHVIAQILKRQTLTDEGYIAIMKPSSKTIMSQTFKDKLLILKRLGIGLIYVDNQAMLIKEAEVVTPRKKHKDKQRLIDTFQALNHENIGGSSQTPRMTLYKKQAMRIAKVIGNSSKKVSDIKKETLIEKTYSILYKNYYQWFHPLGKGIYELTEQGKEDNNI